MSEAKGRSSRTLEEVAELEGATLAKQRRKVTKTTTAAKPVPPKPGKGRGRKGGQGKSS